MKIAGDHADGAIFFQIHATDPTPQATRFREKYEQKYKEPFDALVWRSADILYTFKQAVETSRSLDPTVLKEALRKVKIEGVFGPLRVGGKSYYGIDAQFLFPMPASTSRGLKAGQAVPWRGPRRILRPGPCPRPSTSRSPSTAW
jgi:hypothetical protein